MVPASARGLVEGESDRVEPDRSLPGLFSLVAHGQCGCMLALDAVLYSCELICDSACMVGSASPRDS